MGARRTRTATPHLNICASSFACLVLSNSVPSFSLIPVSVQASLSRHIMSMKSTRHVDGAIRVVLDEKCSRGVREAALDTICDLFFRATSGRLVSVPVAELDASKLLVALSVIIGDWYEHSWDLDSFALNKIFRACSCVASVPFDLAVRDDVLGRDAACELLHLLAAASLRTAEIATAILCMSQPTSTAADSCLRRPASTHEGSSRPSRCPTTRSAAAALQRGAWDLSSPPRRRPGLPCLTPDSR